MPCNKKRGGRMVEGAPYFWHVAKNTPLMSVRLSSITSDITPKKYIWRGGRVVEGARLESV